MDNEALELQQRILDKLEEWRASAEFGTSRYDMQKYKRAKGMLQATHPRVLTEVLGITSVRDIPKESMNQIRTMDLGTLKNLEIFRGMDDKIVGHHMSAFGAISGVLDKQSPERRLELLNRACDQVYITGMDPSGIGPIRTSIHLPIAHEGDFSGKKPGYQTRVFTNDDNIEDVWSAFESSLKQQQGSFYQARAHQSTQDLVSASKGVFGTDLITELDVPMDVRKEASAAADPLAGRLDQVVTEFSGNSEAIEENARRLIDDLDVKQQTRLRKLQMKAGSLTFDTAGMIGRGLTRSILPSAAGGAVALTLGAGDVKAREDRAEQDPSFINNLQVSLAQTERAADVAGLVPGPQTAVAEPAGLGAGLANVAIDIARDPIGTLKAVGGGIKWLVDGGAARQQSQILNPLSTRL